MCLSGDSSRTLQRGCAFGRADILEALVRVSSWATKMWEQNDRDIAAQVIMLAIQMISEDPSQRPHINHIQRYLANTSDRWKQINPHKDFVSPKNLTLPQIVDKLLRRGPLPPTKNNTVTCLVY